MSENSITIYEDSFNKYKKEARDVVISDLGEEDAKNQLDFRNLTWKNMQWEFDGKKDTLDVYGYMEKNGNQLAYVYLSIPIDQDLSLELVDASIKKLQKLKAVLEATK